MIKYASFCSVLSARRQRLRFVVADVRSSRHETDLVYLWNYGIQTAGKVQVKLKVNRFHSARVLFLLPLVQWSVKLSIFDNVNHFIWKLFVSFFNNYWKHINPYICYLVSFLLHVPLFPELFSIVLLQMILVVLCFFVPCVLARSARTSQWFIRILLKFG